MGFLGGSWVVLVARVGLVVLGGSSDFGGVSGWFLVVLNGSDGGFGWF